MKTLGTKLDNDKCQQFIDYCNNEGVSVSEKIRKLILDELEFVENCKDCDKETIEDFRNIRKIIGTHDEGGWMTEDDGTTRSAEFYWFTDEEKKNLNGGEKITVKNEPKIIVTPID